MDTEPVARAAWERALAPYGYVLTDADAQAAIGLPYVRVHAYYAERAELPGAHEFRTALTAELFTLMDRGVTPFDDALQSVAKLRARGPAGGRILQRARPAAGNAGVHGSPRSLRRHRRRGRGGTWQAGTGHLFLTAAERLGVEPRDCTVGEDSPPGVAAGLAAGMVTVAVCRDPGAAESLANADRVLATLTADAILEAPANGDYVREASCAASSAHASQA